MAQSPGATDPMGALLHARDMQRLDGDAKRDVLLAKLQEIAKPIKGKNALSFFKTIESKQGSQLIKAECIACGHRLQAAGSSRLTKHIRTCALMPIEIKQPFTALAA